MAQNEMKAKPALPERVRSMEGLGVGGRRRTLTPLATHLYLRNLRMVVAWNRHSECSVVLELRINFLCCDRSCWPTHVSCLLNIGGKCEHADIERDFRSAAKPEGMICAIVRVVHGRPK